jgi:hypothetical protein
MNVLPLAASAALALLVTLSPAHAATKGKVSPAQAAYQQERARCLRGESGQERATCLHEAAAAYDEARRGKLNNAPDADFARNAVQRCEAQPAADREACVQRLRGAGSTEGSVKGGGLIRETESATH